MVALSVLLTVFIKSGLVASSGILSEREGFAASAHIVETALARGLERFVCSHGLLEVHPVLSSIAKLLLLSW